MLSLSKKLSKQDIYLGVQYVFMKSKLEARFTDSLPSFAKGKAIDNQTGALGVFLDWDKRNSIFTPDNGTRVHLLYSLNNSWTGSDFTYQRA